MQQTLRNSSLRNKIPSLPMKLGFPNNTMRHRCFYEHRMYLNDRLEHCELFQTEPSFMPMNFLRGLSAWPKCGQTYDLTSSNCSHAKASRFYLGAVCNINTLANENLQNNFIRSLKAGDSLLERMLIKQKTGGKVFKIELKHWAAQVGQISQFVCTRRPCFVCRTLNHSS